MIVHCIEVISKDLADQLVIKIESFRWYSLELNETTQWLIFIRGMDDKFVITKESVEHLKNTTTGQDLF